jgi:hypothetical protein
LNLIVLLASSITIYGQPNINDDMNVYESFPKEFKIYSTCVDAQNNVYVLGDERFGMKNAELWVGCIYRFDHKKREEPTLFYDKTGHSGDIAASLDGSIAVADTEHNEVFVLNKKGEKTHSLHIDKPNGIAVTDNAVIFCSGNKIMKLHNTGDPEVLVKNKVLHSSPHAIAVLSDQTIIIVVSPVGIHRPLMYSIMLLDNENKISTLINNTGHQEDGPPGTANVFFPTSIDVDGEDNILICQRNGLMRKIYTKKHWEIDHVSTVHEDRFNDRTGIIVWPHGSPRVAYHDGRRKPHASLDMLGKIIYERNTVPLPHREPRERERLYYPVLLDENLGGPDSRSQFGRTIQSHFAPKRLFNFNAGQTSHVVRIGSKRKFDESDLFTPGAAV